MIKRGNVERNLYIHNTSSPACKLNLNSECWIDTPTPLLSPKLPPPNTDTNEEYVVHYEMGVTWVETA